MGLAEAQRLLARLSTDAALRARYAVDPAGVASEFGLSPAEAASFDRLPAEQLDDFARSLVRKRLGAVESLLPLTRRAFGPARFASWFGRHARTHGPSGIKKHRDDAVAFASFLAGEASDPPWLADLARLESAALLAHDRGHRWSAIRLSYHPSDLARAAVEGGQSPRSRPTIVAWFRAMPATTPRRVVISRPW
jgi:hypothetical protein